MGNHYLGTSMVEFETHEYFIASFILLIGYDGYEYVLS